MELSKQLKKYRLKEEMSQEQLAERIFVSISIKELHFQLFKNIYDFAGEIRDAPLNERTYKVL